MGKTGVETAYSLALSTLSDGLQLDPTNLAKTFLRKKDKRRLAESEYKCTEGAKKLCRLARSKRKGLDDQHQQGSWMLLGRSMQVTVAQVPARR